MLRRNERLAWHTSFHIGGVADYYATVQNVEDLLLALRFAAEHELPVFVLGGGSNILVSDAGIRGLVIENRMQSIHIDPDGHVRVDSGVPLVRLAHLTANRGLAGLEWAAGIPGTVGGAIVNNAAAFGHSMADIISWVGVLSEEGIELVLTPSELDLGYRHSCFTRNGSGKRRGIILEAELALQPSDPQVVRERLREYARRRRQSQPLGLSAGSIFKNPQGDFAGRLIEMAGLKGQRLGHVQISPKHANFILNLGEGQATEVAKLIDLARKTVMDKFGVWLELEIEPVGQWDGWE
jgi:UDP-N-acetylmuramate dehydrogenase